MSFDDGIRYGRPNGEPPEPNGEEPPEHLSSLDGPGLARSTDPSTSHAAAWANLPGKATQRRVLLEAHFWYGGSLEYPGGLTDYELSLLTQGRFRQGSLSTRRSQLKGGRWLFDTKLKRPTDSGSMAVVWGMTEAAKERFRQAVAGEEPS